MSRYLILTPQTKPDGTLQDGMTLVNNIRTHHWQTAATILDFKQQRVTHTRTLNTRDWNTAIAQLYPSYSGIIDMLCQVNKITLDPSIYPAGTAPVDQASLLAAIRAADARAGITREDSRDVHD